MTKVRLAIAADLSELSKIADALEPQFPALAAGIRNQVREIQADEVNTHFHYEAKPTDAAVGLTKGAIEEFTGYRE